MACCGAWHCGKRKITGTHGSALNLPVIVFIIHEADLGSSVRYWHSCAFWQLLLKTSGAQEVSMKKV